MPFFWKSSDKSFAQHLGSVALFWGVPVLCLEMIGVPKGGVVSALFFLLPGTAVGVIVFTIIEVAIADYIKKKRGKNPDGERPAQGP